MGSIDPAGAERRPRWQGAMNSASPGARARPLLAIVSLSDQRVTIYDAEGKMLQSPVSTGSTGYETPAGIYSVVQKKEVHQSNVYEDGNMPFMQRITWTGIALHAGVLPGHPASHGCVRLPIAFAQRLFDLTDIGLRVIVVRDDIAPRRHRPPGSVQAEPGAQRGGAGRAAGRPFVRQRPSAQAESWRRVVRDGNLAIARLGKALADLEVDGSCQDRGSGGGDQEGRRSQAGGRKEGCRSGACRQDAAGGGEPITPGPKSS